MVRQFEKNEHFRHLLLFTFNFKVLRPQKLLATFVRTVYREGAIAERTACDWYAKFKNGNFDLKDAPRSGPSVEFDKERLNQLLHENSRQTTRKLAEKMECSHTIESIFTRWKRFRIVENRFRMLDNNKNQRVTISTGLLARHRSTHEHKQRFLYRIVTGDEKWSCASIWSSARNSLTPVNLEFWLKAKRRRCRKCSFFSTWHSILMTWKLTEVNSNKKKKQIPVEQNILFRMI